MDDLVEVTQALRQRQAQMVQEDFLRFVGRGDAAHPYRPDCYLLRRTIAGWDFHPLKNHAWHGATNMPEFIKRIDHVEVFVRDLDAAARWYAQVLGLREIHRWNPEPIFIGTGDAALALFKGDAASAEAMPSAVSRGPHLPSAVKVPHWHRVAWRTDSAGFEAAQAHLNSLGISFRGPIDHGIAKSIYFSDPDGNRLEVTYYP